MEFMKKFLGFTNQVGGTFKENDIFYYNGILEGIQYPQGRVLHKRTAYGEGNGGTYMVKYDNPKITEHNASSDMMLTSLPPRDYGRELQQVRAEQEASNQSEAQKTNFYVSRLQEEREAAERLAREATERLAREQELLRTQTAPQTKWAVGNTYRNKFTGKIGTVMEIIEPKAWMCIEEEKLICLYEVEMINVSEEPPFIINFNGTPEKLKEEALKTNGNERLVFIKEILNDYLSRGARIAFQNSNLTENELLRIGQECSKPFVDRNLENIRNIKLIQGLTNKYENLLDMLITWDSDMWKELKNHYLTKIRQKQGTVFNYNFFYIYHIELFYNRYMAILRISRGCNAVNTQDLSHSSTFEQSHRQATPAVAAAVYAAAASIRAIDEQVYKPLTGVSRSFTCPPSLELFNSGSIYKFEKIPVSSTTLGISPMKAPAILWEMIGTHVLTDIPSLHLFEFDEQTGKSAFQDIFFSKYDIRVTGCFKGKIPCICIEGGPKILAFAEWVIHNKELYSLRENRSLETEALKLYWVFRKEYSLGEIICLRIHNIFDRVKSQMLDSPFKKLVKTSVEQCSVEQTRTQGLESFRLPRVDELSESASASVSASASSSASALLEASRRQPSRRLTVEGLMQSPLGSLVHPSLARKQLARAQSTRAQLSEQLQQFGLPRAPLPVPRGPFELPRGQESVQPRGRLRQTFYSEENCEALPSSEAAACRKRRDDFSGLSKRTPRYRE
jgi:hypothetical protein